MKTVELAAERAAFEAYARTQPDFDLLLDRYRDGEYKTDFVRSAWRIWQARATPPQSPKGDERAQVTADRTPPFSNCRFKECDLPGQCAGEGKCHHPAVAAAAPQAGVGLTDEQIWEKWCEFATSEKLTAITSAGLAEFTRRMLLSHPTGKAEDAQDAQRMRALCEEVEANRRNVAYVGMPIWDAMCDAIGDDCDSAKFRAAIDAAMTAAQPESGADHD